MPFILPSIDCSYNATFERFKSIVEKYKQVIENDDTARCMIGFTAASMIRNKDDTDLDSFENWLQSIEQQRHNTTEQCDKDMDTKVNKILHVVETESMRYYEEEATSEEEEFSYEDDSIDERDSTHELDRYTSRGPFSSKQSYPNHTYVPDRTFVNHIFESGPEDLFLSIEETYRFNRYNA
jgi:hypothetical protein